MSFEGLVGQEHAVGLLENALAGGTLAHAMIFAGPRGVGKRMAAVRVARALLCREGPGAACGRCVACHRVDAGTHGDFYVVEPESSRSGVSIGQVRALAAALAQSPMEGERKAAIIDPADSMTTQAQNCLLKTLEEPPADTTLMLLAENTDLLLPTVRSRCRRVNFIPLDEQTVRDFLVRRGEDSESAAVVARAARGSLERAGEMAEAVAAGERAKLIEALTGDEGPDSEALRDMICGGAKGSLRQRRESALFGLEILHSFAVDCIRFSAGAAPGTNVDVTRRLEAFAGRHGFERLARLEKDLADAIIMIDMFADVRLVGEKVAAAAERLRRVDTS